jgi:uncharacterized membrane protein required for colicin V production
MTWPDIALLTTLVLFLAVGARLGSLWTASCLAGGFAGACLADMYALSLAGTMMKFPGATFLAGTVLFLAGAAAMIVPGILLSRVFEGLILGVADSAFGLVTGAVAGSLLVTMVLLVVVPMAPRVESSRAWKKSSMVRPLHRTLEDFFQSPKFRRRLSGLGAATGGLRELEPLREKAEDKLKAVVEKAKG